MIVRELSAEEYSRLSAIEEGFVPDPNASVAIVAEDAGEIVGRVLLLALPHVEGTWVREDHRKGTTGARLLKQAETSAKTRGLKALLAYIANPELDNYMERLGYKKMPITVWQKEI